MEFRYRYRGKSQVSNASDSTSLSFAPDSLRPPTYFVGQLKQKLVFREAISALHKVVTSDLRTQPKDRSVYMEWLESENERLLAEFINKKSQAEQEALPLQKRLAELNKQSSDILGPYFKAQNTYFKYLYKNDYDAWFVLDPVITVHPDEVFFECFSEDESSYGKLSCRYDVFDNISETACGTTNIDYSEGLYNEFQKIRDYRSTTLAIDPDGFSIQTTNEEQFDEKKIDLPESWVRGFLQVSSAMTMPMVKLNCHPMDIHNLCYTLRRKKERIGPRAMRFELVPGKAIKVAFEPWNNEVVLARSIYQGEKPQNIRVWGRRRLHILERLIPIADNFTLYLMGDGLPCFYVANMGDISFTLGLSGWTANDWSRMGNFDLLAPRAEVDEISMKRVYKALAETWQESSRSLAQRLQLDEGLVKSALSIYSQSGQVLFDLASGVYRIRELSREPLPLESLRFSSEREEKAANFVTANLVEIKQHTHREGITHLEGSVLDNAVSMSVRISIDADQRLTDAICQCHFFQQNQLRKGPCEHMLALRKMAASKEI